MTVIGGNGSDLEPVVNEDETEETPVSEIPYPEGTAPPVLNDAVHADIQFTLVEAILKFLKESGVPEESIKELRTKTATEIINTMLHTNGGLAESLYGAMSSVSTTPYFLTLNVTGSNVSEYTLSDWKDGSRSAVALFVNGSSSGVVYPVLPFTPIAGGNTRYFVPIAKSGNYPFKSDALELIFDGDDLLVVPHVIQCEIVTTAAITVKQHMAGAGSTTLNLIVDDESTSDMRIAMNKILFHTFTQGTKVKPFYFYAYATSTSAGQCTFGVIGNISGASDVSISANEVLGKIELHSCETYEIEGA